MNVAFTHAGLEKLGVYADVLAMFAAEFREGMTGSEHRRRILGDLEDSAPERWQWGGPGTAGVDVLLMLYASEDRIEAVYQSHAARFAAPASTSSRRSPTIYLPDRKEHFGFRDGIAQPLIEGSRHGRPAREHGRGRRVPPRVSERLRTVHRPAAAGPGREIRAGCSPSRRTGPAGATWAGTAAIWSSGS